MLETDPISQAGETLLRLAADAQLREDDQRLARAIVFGVMRHALTLDYWYGSLLNRPSSSLDERLRLCLRMAACQQWLLSRIPDYAIVSETVDLARSVFRCDSRQTGFLNAVLRKMVALPTPPELPAGNRIAELATRYSFPREVAGLFVKKFGTHKAADIMEKCNREPDFINRVNTLKVGRDQLAAGIREMGYDVQPGTLAPESLIVSGDKSFHDLLHSDLFDAGNFYVQDEASQLVAHLVAPQAGERILDLCSAPGGKATHMAELSGGRARITATDFSETRLALVQENRQRLETPGLEIAPMDEVRASTELFDAILVDAPCSGIGTVRRHPEIRYRITPDSLNRQADRQQEVLDQAASLLRPAGRLIYSTCSVSDAENCQVIRKFLARHPDFKVRQTSMTHPAGLPFHADGFYRTWPSHPDLDGFEAVVLDRT